MAEVSKAADPVAERWTCMRLNIANFLRNQGKRPIRGFTENGMELSDWQVRQNLQAELAAGHAFFPMCQHGNFDHETGWCKGPHAAAIHARGEGE